MKKIILLVVFIISACLIYNYLSQAPEDKINAAFPSTQEIEVLSSDILIKITDSKKKAFINAYESKRKLRALNCGKGYQPAWYETVGSIKASLQNSSCFNDEDNMLKKWLEIIRVGLVMEQDSLRPITVSPKPYILGDEYIRNASFASNAGVSLLRTNKGLQIIDIATNNIIFKESQNKDSYGTDYLSPNGRLFYIANQQGIEIKSSENGALLTTLSPNSGAYFSWINSRFGFYCPQSSNSPVVVDFATGEEIKLRGIDRGVIKAFPIQGALNNQFIVIGGRHAYKYEFTINSNNVTLDLIEEAALKDGNSFAFNASSLTQDGKYLFSAGRDLSIIKVDDFSTQTIGFAPYRIQTVVGTNNPDEIIIKTYNPEGSASVTQQRPEQLFLYSIPNSTISPITGEESLNYRFVHIAPLSSLGLIRDSKIELLDDLSHGDPIAISNFISTAVAEASLKKLQLIEIIKSSAPLASKAENTQIEAVGVYEGEQHKNGNVFVKVKKSTKPIVLVLSSYEGVKWHIVKEPDAKIATILLSGYEQSEVIGAGTIRVTNLGRVYAYQASANKELDDAVFNMTGRRIDFFQGRYKGVTFEVGGL